MENGNKKIAKNTIFLYVRMFFVLIISLYTSRVVLNVLGVNDYGIYNVVAGFVSMFGFLNATLSSSMQRFYNYEGSKRGDAGYDEVYISGLYIHILLAIILFIVLESFGLWYVNNVMVITEGRTLAANVVYQATVISMLLVVLQIPYIGAILADERMDYYAIIGIADIILKLIIVLLLPILPYDSLITYSVLLLLISIVDFICYYSYSKKKILHTNFTINHFWGKNTNRVLSKSILSFSGWNLVGTFAFLLKGQGLNMLLNFFWGPVVNAARGIAMQVNGAVSVFSGNITVAFRPQIVNSFASKEKERCISLMFMESKVCYLLLLCLISPLVFNIDYVLKIWLGDIVPSNTNIFTVLVLIDTLVCIFNTPLTQVAFATGNIKKYQIYSSSVNLLLLPVCYILLKTGLNPTSVFVATIFFSIVNNFICFYAVRNLYSFSIVEYLKRVLYPCIISTLVLTLVPLLLFIYFDPGITRLSFSALGMCVVGLPIIYLLVFTKQEKSYIKSLFKQLKRCPK